MDLVEWLPWVLGGLLAALSIVLGFTLRSRRRRADQELAAAREAHQGEVRQLGQARDQEVRQLEQARDQELERQSSHFSREKAQLRTKSEQLAGDLNRVLGWAASGMRWEWASREAILEVCDDLGLDGVLATNVVFVPPKENDDAVFASQVDHVLVTPAGLLVIESKRWKGLIFDGVKPSSVWPPLGVLIDESKLADSSALQIRQEGDNGLAIRTHTGDRYPAHQVRKQAARLRDFLETVVGSVPWVETCVFYSHPGAVVHATSISRSSRGAKTHVAANTEQLKAAIKALRSEDASSEASWFRETVELLRSLGADTCGLGRYASEWARIFPRGWAEDPEGTRAELTPNRTQRPPDVKVQDVTGQEVAGQDVMAQEVTVPETSEPDDAERTTVLADSEELEHTMILPSVGDASQGAMPSHPFARPHDEPTQRISRS